MLLSTLLKKIETINDYADCMIEGIAADTHTELKGKLYVCICGVHADGHEFAQFALDKGAVRVICQKDLGLPNQIIVADTRHCYALLCKRWFEEKCDKMRLIATTGTNGKTSVTTMVKRILEQSQIKTGLISTIQAEYGETIEELDKTTPDAYQLHRLFSNMQDCGCEAVCMEASSHALDQKRLDGCRFHVAVFTNLTQDHLDYHENMVEYFRAKKKLFSMAEHAVINLDDGYGKQLIEEIEIPYVTFSIEDETADFFADTILCTDEGVSFVLHYHHIETKVSCKIPGIYSVLNSLAAIACCVTIGLSLEHITTALGQMDGIRGRSETIETGRPFHVICDFAHTPDGLENILKSVKQYAKGRVVLVFGCGGDRDRTKRPLMGRIASKYADFLVVTSDNPRTEQPKAIIADILKGISKNMKYIVIPERTAAIAFAVKNAKKDDTIVLAGKGHEQYQILGNKKLFYDERRIVKGCLNAMCVEEKMQQANTFIRKVKVK